MGNGNDAVHEVMESRCDTCRHFLHGTDGGSIGFEGKSYGWCKRPRTGSPFFVVPMAPPDPERPNDPWNNWRPDMSEVKPGENTGRLANLAVLPDHYCSGFEERR